MEGAKTIVGASNRFRVGTDVIYDDFMQLERPLGVKRAPSRLAATRAPPRAAGFIDAAIQPAAKICRRILRLRDWAHGSLLDGGVDEPGCSGRRHESPQGERELARHPGVSPIA